MKKKIFLIVVVILVFCTHMYSETNTELPKDAYIFIDISNSMTPLFTDVQDYVIKSVIPEIPMDTNLQIFKFYGKLVPIFDGQLKTKNDVDYSKQRVGLLLANGPWTNIENVFSFISDNNLDSENSVVYILTDGHGQLNDEHEYFITADNIDNYIDKAELENKGGWFILKWKQVEIVEPNEIFTEITQPMITARKTDSQEKKEFSFPPILIFFLILSILLLLLATISYIFYRKEMTKSIKLDQLERIKDESCKYLWIAIIFFVIEVVCFIACFVLKPLSLLVVTAYVVLSIIVDILAIKVILLTYKKYAEIKYICNSLLEEAKKHDTDIAKEISPDYVAKIEDEHKQLVLGIICLKDIEFNEITALNNVDRAFLWFAVAIQCCRQYLLTSFKPRIDDQKSAKQIKAEFSKPELDENGNPKNIADLVNQVGSADEKSDRQHWWYNPSLEEIINNPVPYDTIKGVKDVDSDIAQHGGHRYTTLGHDPVLGWVFGTANIATSTVTDYQLNSYHVKTGIAYQRAGKDIIMDKLTHKADTDLVLEKTYNKLFHEGEEGQIKIAASLIKQAIHLKSDVNTSHGLPLPGVSSTISPKAAAKLAKYGFDMENIVTIGKQFALSRLINFLVSMIHRLTFDAENENEKLFTVRTKKIINYSNLISGSSNVLAVAMGVIFGKPGSLRFLDVGGIGNSIITYFSNKAFIRQVKIDFILNKLDEKQTNKE